MRSMTGFGAAEGKVGAGVLYVEIKTVNHRFSEYFIKIPPKMGVLDSLVRRYLGDLFSRGKIDVYMKEKSPLFGGQTISLDIDLAKKYHKAISKLRKELGLAKEYDLIGAVGIDKLVHFEEKEGSYERMWNDIKVLLKKAAGKVVTMQQREGAHIKKDQRARLTKTGKFVTQIMAQTQRVRDQNFDRVRRRVSGNGADSSLDEGKIAMEVSLIGGRQDIVEELTRLESHIAQYKKILDIKGPVGRNIDFLLQEMHREINTIGAKASDAAISALVVDCKAEIERLKEQVQNIE